MCVTCFSSYRWRRKLCGSPVSRRTPTATGQPYIYIYVCVCTYVYIYTYTYTYTYTYKERERRGGHRTMPAYSSPGSERYLSNRNRSHTHKHTHTTRTAPQTTTRRTSPLTYEAPVPYPKRTGGGGSCAGRLPRSGYRRLPYAKSALLITCFFNVVLFLLCVCVCDLFL